MPAKAKEEAAGPVAEDRGHDVPEADEARVHLVQTHAVHAGADDEGNALDHIGTPYDHVIEVSN